MIGERAGDGVIGDTAWTWGGHELPTLDSGKYLTNDGTDLSWGAVDTSTLLLLDGTRSMTGDFNTGGNNIKMGAGLIGYDGTASEGLSFDTNGNVTLEATAGSLILPLNNDATTPTLAFGDGNTGFYESSDNVFILAVGGSAVWRFESGKMSDASIVTGSPRILAETASSTNPVYSFVGDQDTGIGWAGADQLSLIAGGVEGIRITEATTVTITANGWFDRHTVAGITASTTQSQGQQALTADVNQVSTVGNANDVVTLPTAVAGRVCIVINDGANNLQVYPASGDDLGAGVNTSETIANGKSKRYVAYDTTNWEAFADN